jgi:hypothetical protein
MVLKIPPPPPIANSDPTFNRWLLELTNILNGGSSDLSILTAPTPPSGDNSTKIATTAFVAGAVGSTPSSTVPLMDSTPGHVGTATTFARGDHQHPTDTSLAPLASPTFTGAPQGPTAAPGANNNVLATTAFVATSFAPLASPTFTGTPAAPTAAPGTNTTQLATTAFVQAAVGASAGGRTLLATLTAASSANLSDTTHITGAFQDYEIVFDNLLPGTANVSISLQVNVGGVQTAGYQSAAFGVNSGAGATAAAVSTTGILLTLAANAANTGAGLCGTLRIYDASQTTSPKPISGLMTYAVNGAGTNAFFVGGEWAGGNGAVTGIQIAASGGVLLSGSVKIYGLS